MLRRALLPLIVVLAVPPVAAAQDPDYDVTIRRTAHGIPHIKAQDFGSLGYGYGYSFAQDNICTMADSYVTVRGERSRYFGPDGTWELRGNGSENRNLESDFFFKRIIDRRTIEKLMAQPPPNGPRPEVFEAVRGYVAGYNRYLAETGVENLPDPTCRGKEWVKPIEEIDAYRRFYQLALLASGAVAINGIGGAQPPTPATGGGAAPLPTGRELDELEQGLPLGGIGSNAYGIGRDQTDNGRGMLLGNPHFPWDGSERFYQAHATIPGKMDAAGGSLFGVPVILIGHTRGLAWSHTVSTAFRFTPFEEKLVPGSPTTYLVDGQPRQMERDEVTVQVRMPDGRLEPRTRTLYSTHHGPIFTELLGQPLFPWTPASAFAMGDANAANFRYLNHFFETNQAQTVREYDQILRRNQGIPWVNSIAADAKGEAYYADISVVPHVTDEHAQRCNTALGTATFEALRLPVLDGLRSDCDWGRDPSAIQPGTFGPDEHLPSMFRTDYVMNGNDSYWLGNLRQRLEGFPKIIGDERKARTLRTRLGLHMVHDQKFTLRKLQDTMFNNRQYAGELWRDELVGVCDQTPGMADACAALRAWNVRDDLDSRGALLFRRIAQRLLADRAGAPYRVPFDVEDPANTPRGLRTEDPRVRQALVEAVNELRGKGIALDAPLGDVQAEVRGSERLPIHGGPGTAGVFNAINVQTADIQGEGRGYENVEHGSSFVQAVQFRGRGCPVEARTILTYSQSANPESPFYSDQTRMYARKQWNDTAFCERAVARATLCTTRLTSGGRTTTRCAPCRRSRAFRSTRVRPRGSGLRIAFTPRRRATIDIFRVSAGRRVLGNRRVALFRSRRRGVTWDGSGAGGDGLFIVRLRAKALRGTDTRRIAVVRRNGRFRVLPPYYRRKSCGLLTSFKLERPAFGGPRNRALGIAFRTSQRARVSVRVHRAGKTVRRYRAARRAGRMTHRLRLASEGMPRGAYRVTITVRAGGRRVRATLVANRL